LFRPDGTYMPHDQCPMADVLAGTLSEAADAEVLIERPDGSRITVIVNIRPLKKNVLHALPAVWNLLSNAAKFTATGGRVEVRTRLDDGQIELTVTDSGVGIDATFLPYAFDRFRQADASSTRAQSGLGLGLAIVRHLVELHGGSVRAESGGRDAGTRFVVRLPRRHVPLTPRDARSPARVSATPAATGGL
jgi:signal transduction histidine kinase